MNQNEKLRWGIIGLGGIAHKFVEDIQLTDRSIVTAVASRNNEKASLFAKKFDVENFYGTYDPIFQDDKVDIVYIATPHDSHAELTIRALESGKHVLCEKPLAVNEKQVLAMVKASVDNNRFLMEALWTRFNPTFVKAKGLIDNGEIGLVNYVNADFTFHRSDPPDSRMLNMELAGGSLLDMGIYPVFLTYAILGVPVEILATARFHETGADIQTAAILKYPNGIAKIMSGFCSQSEMRAEIHGEKGRILIHPVWHESQSLAIINNSRTRQIEIPKKGKGFTYEIEECVDCIHSGKIESSIWSHKNSIELIRILDTIRKKTGLVYPFE